MVLVIFPAQSPRSRDFLGYVNAEEYLEPVSSVTNATDELIAGLVDRAYMECCDKSQL